jgi:hypothetical protein
MESKKPTMLENFASPLKSANHFIKASFGGFAGSGKTRTATEFIIGCYKEMNLKKPILFIDNEKGSRFLIPIFEKAGIKIFVKDTIYLADIIQSFDLIKNGEVDFLFMDSLTKVWYQFIKEYKAKNGNKSFMTLQDWGKVLPDWQEKFSNRFVDLNGNCVFTGRGGYTYDMEENEETKKKEFTKSGVKMKLAGETPFEPDINVWMELCQEMEEGKLKVWREAQIMKDRSGTIDGKTFKNPTYSDFAPVVRFILSTPIGEVAGSHNQDSMAPTENFESQNRRDQRDIELEKIQSLFDENHIGSQGKDEKELKIAILKKIFNTSSKTEIEKMQPERLRACRESMELLFEEWQLLTDHVGRMNFVKNFEPSFLFNPAK